VLHELLERLDAHLKAEQFYSGGCLLHHTAEEVPQVPQLFELRAVASLLVTVWTALYRVMFVDSCYRYCAGRAGWRM
jgi:hypothetical protein